MEKFRTLIRKEHEHSRWNCYNEYVVGCIRGIQLVMCCVDFEYPHQRNEDGLILPVKCTKEQYQKFAEFVEESYPGLCEFDYKKAAEEV